MRLRKVLIAEIVVFWIPSSVLYGLFGAVIIPISFFSIDNHFDKFLLLLFIGVAIFWAIICSIILGLSYSIFKSPHLIKLWSSGIYIGLALVIIDILLNVKTNNFLHIFLGIGSVFILCHILFIRHFTDNNAHKCERQTAPPP